MTPFSLVTNRKETKNWLWEELLRLTIKDHNLKGEDESEFRHKPNHYWLKDTAENLIPDCNLDTFKLLKLNHPPSDKPKYQYYTNPRAKKPKTEEK